MATFVDIKSGANLVQNNPTDIPTQDTGLVSNSANASQRFDLTDRIEGYVGNHVAADAANGYTIYALVRIPNGQSLEQTRMIWSLQGDNAGGTSLNHYWYSDGTFYTSGISSTSIPDAQDYVKRHVAFRKAAGNQNATCNIYVDGAKGNDDSTVAANQFITSSGPFKLILGYTNAIPADLIVDDVIIFDEPISDGQIAADAAQALSGTGYQADMLARASTVNYYKLDESGAANTAPTVGAVTIETATIYANTTPIQAKVASVSDAEQASATLTWRLKKGVTTIQTITEAGVALPATDRTVNFNSFGSIAKGDSLTVELTVDDLQGADNTTVVSSAAKTVANSTPSVNSVTLTPLPIGTNGTATATYSAGDADTADVLTPTYLWERDTQGDNNWVTVGGNTATLDLSQPGNGDAGDRIRCTVTVSDGTASSAPLTSAAATITNVASTWTASIASQAVQEGDLVQLVATASDEDGDPISFSLIADASGGAATLTPAAQVGNSRDVTFEWQVPADAAATPGRVFTIRATSAGGTSDMTFTLTVGNTAPVAAAIGAQVVNRGATLEVALSATDANGHDVDFIVRFWQGLVEVAMPAWASVVPLTETTAKLVLAPPLSGASEAYTVTVEPRDGV